MEVRVRFELTTLRICNPLHLTTLPSHYNFGQKYGNRTHINGITIRGVNRYTNNCIIGGLMG